MIRPALMLSTLPFEELLADVQLLLQHDAKELERQMSYFHRLKEEGQKPQAYLDRMEERLEHAQMRYEFFNALLCRCQTYHLRSIALALERAEQEARAYGNPNQYGVIVAFSGQAMPQITPF